MVSGVRSEGDDRRRVRKSILNRETDIVDDYKVWDESTSLSSLAGGGTPDRGGGDATGNFMPLADGTWLGPHGNNSVIVIIENGVFNASNNTGADSSHIGINPEGGVADFLDWIIPGTDVLFYQEEIFQTFNQNITFRPHIDFTITNIVGNGVDNTITVTVSSGGALSTGDTIQVSNTTNFNSDLVPITKTGTDTFTFEFTSIGSAVAENSGDVDRGNIEPPSNANYISEAFNTSHWIYDTARALWQWQSAFNASGSGGGGSGTPPFQYGLTLIATTTGNAVLDLDPNSGAKGQHFIFSNELTGDVDITFTNTPADGFSQPYIIEYKLGATVFEVTFNGTTDVTPIEGSANAITKLAGYITNNGGLISSNFTMTSTAGTGGSEVPAGTAPFQHLEWSGSAWFAQDTLAFGVTSGTTAKLNFPNNTIALAFRNSLNTGNIELKVNTAGSLDLTRDDDTAMDFTIRSQHASESDQSLGITVGSGAVADTTTVFGASTAKMAFEAGGAKRLEIDVTATTALTLKSPEGVTAQSNFNVISTHVTENDQAISIFVGSGDSADGVLETSAPVLKTSVGGATRLEIDASAGTQITQTSYLDTNPSYTFFRDDDTPSVGNPLGIIQFSGKRTDNTNAFVYSSIHGEVSDPTELSPDGRLILKVNNIGTLLNAITMEGSQSLSGTDVLTTIGGALSIKHNITGTNALLTLVRNDISPNPSNILGTINFSGRQSTGILDFIYGSIFVESTDVTVDTLDGTMYFSTITNNVLLPTLTLKNSGSILVSDFIPAADDTFDLGTSSLQWKNLYIVGDIISDDIINITVVDDFRVNKSGVLKISYNGGNDTINFETDVLVNGGNAIRSEDNGEIGFFVTNTSVSVGTEGANQIPSGSIVAPTSIAKLDTAFGSAVGCTGQYDLSEISTKLAIKTRSNEWVELLIPPGGGNVVSNHINS